MAPAATAGTSIRIDAPGLQGRRAATWLADVARFAPIPVLLDGSPVRDGFAGSLANGPLRAPLRGRVALLAEGETAHAYLLAQGLVTAHITIPGAPPFQAAVELGGDREPTPNQLRDRVLPHVPTLIEEAVALLAATAARLGGTSAESTRARLARLTLQTARSHAAAERIALFRTVGGGSAELVEMVDLATLRRLAAADAAAPLPVLASDQRPDRYALPPGPVVVADAAERSLLSEALGVRFRTPPRCQSPRSLTASARRLLLAARRHLVAGGCWLRHPLRPRLVAEDALTAGERGLLFALRADLRSAGLGAVLCEGEGPVRRVGGRPPTLVLPRANPTVLACVRAVAADPSWLRPARLALLEGKGASF
jgi:hypothetical protein